jgi:uncharacterized protein
MLHPISLPDLWRSPQHEQSIEFAQTIADFPTLTPVEGNVRLVHRGNFLEVNGRAKTIVTLTCDRCLQTYNHRVDVELQEILWIEELPPATGELELAAEDLVETLSPEGEFDLQDWIYQHLWLSLPQQQICQTDCSGLPESKAESLQVDRRWTALRQLKEHLN